MNYDARDEDLIKKYPHFERMVDERFVLNDRVSKLDTFIKSNGFNNLSKEEQVLMEKQLPFMQGHLDILDQRIQYYRDNK